MSEQTANLCTTDACESLRARLAKYEDDEGNPKAQPSGVIPGVLAECFFHDLPDEDDWEVHDPRHVSGDCDGCVQAVIVSRADWERLNSPPVSTGGVDERAAVQSDISCDSAYRNGLIAGFGFGINDDEVGYQRSLACYQGEIHKARASMNKHQASCASGWATFDDWWASTPILGDNKRTIAEKAWKARAALSAPSHGEQVRVPDGEPDWPEYHYSGMGCGLEDRGITDRYEAMQHGWDDAFERCVIAFNDWIAATPSAVSQKGQE